MVNETETATNSTNATSAAETSTQKAQASATNYIWSYISSTVGGQTTLPPIWWFGTVFLLSAILLCYRKRPTTLSITKNGLSLPILIVFINHLLNNSVFIISTYLVNYIVNYDVQVLGVNGWLNTWWSFWAGNYLIAGPCAAFFVTLDRFLALKLALHYTPQVQRRMNNVAIASMLALYMFSFANVMIAWPYNDDCITPGTEKNPIANRPCLPLLNKIVNYTQQVINVGLSVANIVIGVTFVVKLMATKIPNVKDGIVRITIVCELIFHAFPGIIQLIFSITEIMINLNVYTFFLASLDAFICSILYAKLLFKIFNENNNRGSAVGPNDQKMRVTRVPKNSTNFF